MKKIIISLSILSIILLLNIKSTVAESYYYEETIEVIETANTRAASTKTGKKTGRYKNSSGNTLWQVADTGTFTYNGSSSNCTSSKGSVTSNNPSWVSVNVSPSKSGNSASAKGVAGIVTNGAVTNKVSLTVTLKCSKSGVLS